MVIRASDKADICICVMTLRNPKGCTLSPHCASPGHSIIIRGETQKMNNYRSQCNQSLADHLLHDGRVISLVWFLETYFWLCGQNHYRVMCMCETSLLLGWTLSECLVTHFNTRDGPGDFLWPQVIRSPGDAMSLTAENSFALQHEKGCFSTYFSTKMGRIQNLQQYMNKKSTLAGMVQDK